MGIETYFFYNSGWPEISELRLIAKEYERAADIFDSLKKTLPYQKYGGTLWSIDQDGDYEYNKAYLWIADKGIPYILPLLIDLEFTDWDFRDIEEELPSFLCYPFKESFPNMTLYDDHGNYFDPKNIRPDTIKEIISWNDPYINQLYKIQGDN